MCHVSIFMDSNGLFHNVSHVALEIKIKDLNWSKLSIRNTILNMYRYLCNSLRKYAVVSRSRRLYSKKLEVEENEPIRFSTSEAARKTTKPIMRKMDPNMPWYQPFSVVGSVAVFLIYFCILREENDVDLEFDKTLYERIKGLEKEQLLQSYRFNKEHGKSVVEIEQRLRELEAAENNVEVA